MSAGELKERVAVQKATYTNGVPSWSTYVTVWASVEPWNTQRDEILAGVQPEAENHYRVTMWYRPDIAPTMRIQWTPYRSTRAKTLDISAVSPQPDHVWLRLDCVEVL